MKSSLFIVGAFALAVLAFAITALPQRVVAAGESPAAEIKIDNFSFTPQTVTVSAGTQVTWVNHDDIPHTVVSEDLVSFRSRALDTDESWSFTFTKPGTYTYFCSIHPKMTAKVVVR